MYPYYRWSHIGSHLIIFLSLTSELKGGFVWLVGWFLVFFSEAQIKYNFSSYSGVLNHE